MKAPEDTEEETKDNESVVDVVSVYGVASLQCECLRVGLWLCDGLWLRDGIWCSLEAVCSHRFFFFPYLFLHI